MTLMLASVIDASEAELAVRGGADVVDFEDPRQGVLAAASWEAIEAGVKAVCDRPDIRDLKSMVAWEQCKDTAMTAANEQLARQGARVAAN